MIENVELLFTVFGVIAVIFVILELVLDIDTFAGKFIAKIKASKSKGIETIDEEFDEIKKL